MGVLRSYRVQSSSKPSLFADYRQITKVCNVMNAAVKKYHMFNGVLASAFDEESLGVGTLM